MTNDLFSALDQAAVEADDARVSQPGPAGRIPLSPEMLRNWPSGDLFGLSQNVGMGVRPEAAVRDPVLILSTQGGIRSEDGVPVALGYHTGHFEVGVLARIAAERVAAAGALPFAGVVTDPCDGRTQGTRGMFDSLPYRNDAAQVLGRLVRSLPTRRGVMGIATCDKGLPAMMMALAGLGPLPGILVPGGTTLMAAGGEDAGKVQTIGARFSHGEMGIEEAQEAACQACASPGGGCQFLGTAATAQVVAEALGMALPHSALVPSGQSLWRRLAESSADALLARIGEGGGMAAILTPAAVHNAMVLHAAFGGSTNLLLHLPAVAHAAGLAVPTRAEWDQVNRQTPRLVSVLPNGPELYPTAAVFFAGGVPEVMLHLRALGLLDLRVETVAGRSLGEVLDWWEGSHRRAVLKDRLRRVQGIDPDRVILSPGAARAAGMTPTLTFPSGNLAPEGAVVKSTAIDPALLDQHGVYHHRGPARVFCSERAAMEAVKAGAIRPGDVLALIGRGPMGSGMEETYQLTSALRYLSFGKSVALITDARFSGVSTGACVGHVSPEALAGGPLGRLRDGDLVEVEIDTRGLTGRIDMVGTEARGQVEPSEGARILAERPPHPDLAPDPDLPGATRLWAALQAASGGPWAGAVYDVERILEVIERGLRRGDAP